MIYRGEWQDPAKPVTGPARKAATTATIVHYEGGGRTSHVADGAQWCRNAQSAYLRIRNYSLGYNYAVVSGGPQDGLTYEIRGTDINNAANKGDDRLAFPYNANNYTRSIIVLGIEGQSMTGMAMWSVADMTVGGLFGHRDVDSTSCPGDPYYAQIPAIRQLGNEPEDDMKPNYLWKHEFRPGMFWVCDGSVVHIDAAVRDSLISLGVVQIVSNNNEVHASYMRVAMGK